MIKLLLKIHHWLLRNMDADGMAGVFRQWKEDEMERSPSADEARKDREDD